MIIAVFHFFCSIGRKWHSLVLHKVIGIIISFIVWSQIFTFKKSIIWLFIFHFLMFLKIQNYGSYSKCPKIMWGVSHVMAHGLFWKFLKTEGLKLRSVFCELFRAFRNSIRYSYIFTNFSLCSSSAFFRATFLSSSITLRSLSNLSACKSGVTSADLVFSIFLTISWFFFTVIYFTLKISLDLAYWRYSPLPFRIVITNLTDNHVRCFL